MDFQLTPSNKILCIGNISVDIKAYTPEEDNTEAYRDGSIELVPGGDARGMAINMKHLGLNTAIMSVIGNDIFGDYLLHGLKKEDIDTSLLKVSKNCSTSLFSVMASPNKNASCIYSTKILREIELDDAAINYIKNQNVKALVMDSNLSETTFENIYKLKENNPDIFVFQNATAPDLAKKTVKYAHLIDLFGCNEYEATTIIDEEAVPDLSTAKKFKELGFKNFIITFGDRGVMVQIEDKTWIEPPYVPSQVVDTIGAGDAFASGFLMGFLNKESIKRCIHYGLACAKETLLTRQTVSPLLSRNFLESYPETTQQSE